MLEKIIQSGTNYLIRHRVVEEEDRDIYEYGFHMLYNNLITIAAVCVIAIWLNMVPEVIVYHIVFICLRNSAGGYHSKTYLRCFFMSTCILLLSLIGISHINSPILNIVFACLSVLLIWYKAPVEHENSPLSTEKRKKLKRISRVLSLLFLVVLLLFNFAPVTYRWVATSLAFGMVSHAILFGAALLEAKFYKKTA